MLKCLYMKIKTYSLTKFQSFQKHLPVYYNQSKKWPEDEDVGRSAASLWE